MTSKTCLLPFYCLKMGGTFMQIFQPFKCFEDCAEFLKRDPKRLGKQIVELYQIYNAVFAKLNNQKHGYTQHPMVLHIYNFGKPYNLFPYIDALNREWLKLSYHRSEEFMQKINALQNNLTPYFTQEPYQPFFCKSSDYSYDDVYKKYQTLLLEKWGIDINDDGLA